LQFDFLLCSTQSAPQVRFFYAYDSFLNPHFKSSSNEIFDYL